MDQFSGGLTSQIPAFVAGGRAAGGAALRDLLQNPVPTAERGIVASTCCW
jgi:hypothetical protein